VKRAAAATIVILLSVTLSAKDKKSQQPIPDEILRGEYIRVLAFTVKPQESKRGPVDVDTGQRIDLQSIEDRKAIRDVEDAIKKWGRFKVTYLTDADFYIAVRRGRVVLGRVGGDVDFPTGTPGATIGGEFGPSEDMLAVYRRNSVFHGFDPDGIPVWRVRKSNGLQPPAMSAFEEFRKAVELSDKMIKERKAP
jgi:hypothetical protein